MVQVGLVVPVGHQELLVALDQLDPQELLKQQIKFQ
jgi:hypothetical protein